MGVIGNISADSFPRQNPDVGNRVRVCFKFNTTRQLGGVIVRDDEEGPGVMIIRLDDGRHVLATECQWRPE